MARACRDKRMQPKLTLGLGGALLLLLCVQAGMIEASEASPGVVRSLLLFPSSDCGSQAEILTIGVELLRRGHRMVALVADGCAEEARQLLRSDKFLDPLPEPSTNGAGFVNSTGTPTTSRSSSSSSNSSSSSSSSAGTSMGAKEVGGSCGSMGPIEGEEGGLSKGSCSLGEAGFEAGKGEGGLGVHEEDDVSPQQQQQQEQEQEKQEKDRQLQQQQQQQQQRKASRDALLQSMKLVVYPGHVSLEEFVATKAMLHDESTRMSLAHRTDFTLTNCGSLMANTGVMADLKGAGFDALVGDLSDACAWPLADALGVDARIDVDVTGSPAPPYLAYNMRYPLAYVPAEGSGLAGGSLTMMEKVKNLACHIKLWWEKWTVRVPKVEAFRRQYTELHPGLLRGQQTQHAQQAQQVQQAQHKQSPNMNPVEGSTGLPPTLNQQRQQKQRVALENELNSIKDVRLSTLLCIVTADWAFQEPYALPPLVKHVGPVGPGPVKPLPLALKTFLEAKGRRSLTSKATGDQADPPAPPVVVVGSFSTGHYRLPRQAIVGLAEAFSELTLLRIVWHLPEGVQQKLGQWYRPVSLARHVHLTSHLPLNDLLGHPNVRAFMCDGSLSSMYHALWHGVPMLTVALTVEQESNVVRALRLGVGRRLQRSHLEQGFGFMVEHTLGRLCASTAYRIRAAELSRRMQAANPTPAKSAAEAIEGALEAGTSTFLHSMEVFLPWWKVMMLDVLAAFLAIILGTVASIWAATMLISKAAAWAQGNGGREAQSPAEEMKKFR